MFRSLINFISLSCCIIIFIFSPFCFCFSSLPVWLAAVVAQLLGFSSPIRTLVCLQHLAPIHATFLIFSSHSQTYCLICVYDTPIAETMPHFLPSDVSTDLKPLHNQGARLFSVFCYSSVLNPLSRFVRLLGLSRCHSICTFFYGLSLA